MHTLMLSFRMSDNFTHYRIWRKLKRLVVLHPEYSCWFCQINAFLHLIWNSIWVYFVIFLTSIVFRFIYGWSLLFGSRRLGYRAQKSTDCHSEGIFAHGAICATVKSTASYQLVFVRPEVAKSTHPSIDDWFAFREQTISDKSDFISLFQRKQKFAFPRVNKGCWLLLEKPH